MHPWPEPWARDAPVAKLWVYELAGAPEALWPWIADTSRLNRALGMPEMAFEEREGRRWGRARHGGMSHVWRELPWNWVANQWMTMLRVYERGYVKAVWTVARLEPTPTGTRLYVYFGTHPRGRLARVVTQLGLSSIKRAYDRVIPALAMQLDRLRPAVLQQAPAVLAPSAEARITAQRGQLVAAGLAPAAVDALLEWIRTGDDQDLHRIQIRERARVWKLPEQELLRVALHATRAGLLELSWDTVCPHCRGPRDGSPSLGALAAHAHCDACNVAFTTDTQETVEVTFRVHPSIREVPEQLYCSAEPAKKSHVRVQWTVPAGGAVALTPRLAPGRYTVHRDHANPWYLDVGTAPADADAASEPVIHWWPHPPGTVVHATPATEVRIENTASEHALFSIEEAKWSDHALRAGQLLSLQDFRDLFSEEYIGADVKLAIGEQTLLFTDVVGSTAFYASRGDPGAFIEIKRHFEEVFAIVREHRGAVVKTIGDAVMATFGDPLDAVRASRAIHDAFMPARADSPIRLRISLNTGPCIAVRLNSNADFFGGTVNIAAKLQALAEGHQIAMSEATFRGPGVAEYLAREDITLEELVYTSKALSEPVAVRRWTVHRGE